MSSMTAGTKIEIKHHPTTQEITLLENAHFNLYEATRQLIASIKGIAGVRPTPAQQKRFDDSKLIWMQQLTTCRRGILHPGFYDPVSCAFTKDDLGTYVKIENGKVYKWNEHSYEMLSIDWRMDNKTRNDSFKYNLLPSIAILPDASLNIL